MFVDALPEDVAHFGKRLVSYSQVEPDGPLQLCFSDDTTASCDILVGCDGIKSTVRKQMFEEKVAATGQKALLRYIDPVWTGTMAYRGLIPVDHLRARHGGEHRTVETPMMVHLNHRPFVGHELSRSRYSTAARARYVSRCYSMTTPRKSSRSQHVVSYSISRGSVVNVVAFASRPELDSTSYDQEWVVNCTKEELLECYDGWEPEVMDIIKVRAKLSAADIHALTHEQCIEQPTRWAIHHLKPLPTYVSGRIALLGDAVSQPLQL